MDGWSFFPSPLPAFTPSFPSFALLPFFLPSLPPRPPSLLTLLPLSPSSFPSLLPPFSFPSLFLLSFSFWAAAPKGTKSCRTQGDFRSSFRSSVCPFVPPGPLRPEICPLRPEIYPLRPEIYPQTCNLSSRPSQTDSSEVHLIIPFFHAKTTY